MFPRRIEWLLAPVVRRLVILGDPHGAVAAVRAVLARERTGPETMALCVGDAVGHSDGPDSSALCELLEHERIVSVQGNHEEWSVRAGEIAIAHRRGDDRRLSARALAWAAALPQRVDLVRSAGEPPVATMVHSIREPFWEDVEVNNLRHLLRHVSPVPLVIIGHSHCARLLHQPPDGRPVQSAFDWIGTEELGLPIPAAGFSVVDAGSIGSPRFGGRSGAKLPGFGTYAVVDLDARQVQLRRVAVEYRP